MRALDELERRLVHAIDTPQRTWQPAPVRRRWLSAAGLALVASVAGLFVLLSAGDGVVHPTAAQALEHAAKVAAAADPVPTLQPGEFWYVRAKGITQMPLPLPDVGATRRPAFVEVRARTVQETWIGTGPRARTRWVIRYPLELASTRDRTRWRAAGSPPLDLGPGADTVFEKARGLPIGLGMFSYRQLRHLPTNPHRLLHVLAQAAHRSSTARSAPHFGPAMLALTEFDAIRGLLAAPLQPAARSALFRTAALIPGMRYLGTKHDTLGRPGVAIGLNWRQHIRSTLIFDPHNAALLGVNDDQAGDGVAYVAQGRVDSLQQTPANVAPLTGRLPPERVSNQPRRHR